MKAYWLTAVAASVAALIIMPAGKASASCQCACVNGEVEAICSSSLDLQPICAPRICPIVPPGVRPIESPTIPPIGASRCRSEMVWTGQEYEWIRLCE